MKLCLEAESRLDHDAHLPDTERLDRSRTGEHFADWIRDGAGTAPGTDARDDAAPLPRLGAAATLGARDVGGRVCRSLVRHRAASVARAQSVVARASRATGWRCGQSSRVDI